MITFEPPKKRIELSVPSAMLTQIEGRQRYFGFKTRNAFILQAALSYGDAPRLSELETLAEIAGVLHEIRDMLIGGDLPEAAGLMEKASAFFASHMPLSRG